MASKGIHAVGCLAATLLIGTLAARGAAALEADEISAAEVQNVEIHSAFMPAPVKAFGSAADALGAAKNAAAFGGGVPGIDSIVNFTGQFSANGVDPNGNPQTVWQYAMVGNSPELGGTTIIDAPIIPITVELLDADGKVREVTNSNGHKVRLVSSPHKIIKTVLESPLFQNFTYTSSRTPTQYTDAIQRAEFFSIVDDEGDEGSPWHTLLKPSVKKGHTIRIPMGLYVFALNADGSCCLEIRIDEGTFINLVFPPTFPVDDTTVLGAAELSGDVTTKTLATLLFSDVVLYTDGIPTHCCIGGFHSLDFEPGVPENGNLPRLYVMNFAGFTPPGVFKHGVADIAGLSHELAETFNDPFVAFDGVHNVTPWWLSPDGGQCQDVMEVGDVLEFVGDPHFPITLNGFTYHPQDVAILPWFEFKKHSHAVDHAYSYPDPTVLPALSPVETVNCK